MAGELPAAGAPGSTPSFTAAEIDFFAQEGKIRINPNFSGDAIELMSETVGPFQPGVALEVPLWLAVHLKKTQKCHILPPDWISVENLKRSLEEEMNDKESASRMPYHYREIAATLLTHAQDDIHNPLEVQGYIEDLWNIRTSKYFEGLKKADGDPQRLRNISAMELNLIRGSVVEVFNTMQKLKTPSS